MGFSGQIQRHPSQAGLFDFAVLQYRRYLRLLWVFIAMQWIA